jgi:hypothetical protein
MENKDLLNSQLEVGDAAAAHLSDTAKWGKFLAIVGFIGCGLLLLGGLVFMVAVNSLGGYYSSVFSGMGPVIGVIYLAIAVLYFFPCLFLLRFSNKMKAALLSNDQEALNEAFNQHRRFYKFVGILVIIIISFYVLAILLTGLGTAFR